MGWGVLTRLSSALRQLLRDSHTQIYLSPRRAGHVTEAAGASAVQLPVSRSWGSRDIIHWSLHQTLSLSPVSSHPESLSPPGAQRPLPAQDSCSLLTLLPIVPDLGVLPHMPDLDGVLHHKPLPVTWALGLLWSLAVGVGVQCLPPWPTRHTGGALPPGMVGVNGSHKPGNTTSITPAPREANRGHSR